MVYNSQRNVLKKKAETWILTNQTPHNIGQEFLEDKPQTFIFLLEHLCVCVCVSFAYF